MRRYGRFLHLGPENLARAEAAIRRAGWRAIVLGRLIPGLRIATPIAAAVLGVPCRVFLPAVALGAFLYLGFFTLLGALVGPAALAFLERAALPTGALVSLAALAVVVHLARTLKRALPAGAGGGRWAASAPLVDGLLAGLAALLATNGLVGLAISAARLLGAWVPVIATEVGTTLRLLLGWPAFLIVAGLLGFTYDRLGVARRPRPARVAVTPALPLAVTLALAAALPAWFAAGGAAVWGAPLVAIEALRWLAYGVALGEALVLDTTLHRAASPARPRPGARSAT